MMDLTPAAQAILVYTVLAVGVLATVLTGFAQLRELPRAWTLRQNPALVRRGFLAASVGMGSIGGSILALEVGGPGAIAWMWVASILGMGLIYAEVRLSLRFRREVGGRRQAGTVHAFADGLPAMTGVLGRILATLVLAVLLTACLLGIVSVGLVLVQRSLVWLVAWGLTSMTGAELIAIQNTLLRPLVLGGAVGVIFVILSLLRPSSSIGGAIAEARRDVQEFVLRGRSLALLYALGFMVFAIAAGSMLQTQQSGVLLTPLGGERWLVAVFLVIAAGIGMLVPKLREFVAALGPVAVGLYAIAASLLIAGGPSSAVAAMGRILAGFTTGASGAELGGGAAGAGLLMAMQVGFLRATLATEAGLGSAGFTPQADAAKDPAQAAATAMLAPLVSGIVVPTLTALVAMTSTQWVGQRIDEPGERYEAPDMREASPGELVELAAVLTDGDVERLGAADRRRVMAMWAPLERPQSRGTAASLQAGQTIVLPVDAMAPEGAVEGEAILPDHVYPMLMRASPRGAKVPIREGQDSIILNAAEESEVIREIVYRDRDRERGNYIAYDLRIPVETEVYGTAERTYVRLTPVDVDVDLFRLSQIRNGPYVVFGDYRFDARVVEMHAARYRTHYAMFEAEPDPTRPLSLRTTITGFRGPYFDNGELRPPKAMVAREDFDAELGARLLMEFRVPERGLDLGRLLASGELTTPPWNFLVDTEWAVMRHAAEPALDRKVRVTSKFVDGTLRFVNVDRNQNFANEKLWAGFDGPHLLPEPYRFEVEVHSGARVPASNTYLSRLGLERKMLVGPFSDRKTLVAVHPHGEAQGSRGELYDPHPMEVAPFMDGPWVSGGGLSRVGWAARLKSKTGNAMLLAISVLILALTTMIAWAGYGARAADFAFGYGAGVGFRVVFLLCGLGGAALTIMPILKIADYTMLGLIVLNGVGVIALLVRERWFEAPEKDASA